MSGLRLTFDTRGLDDIVQRFEAAAGEADRATRNAARKTARSLRRELARSLQSSTGVSSKIIRRRFRIYDTFDKATGAWGVRAWFGTYPVDPLEAGARKGGKGIVTAKGDTFPDAFFAKVKGKTKVAQRHGPRIVINGRRQQALRFPKVHIHERAVKALQHALPKAQREFVDEFTAQLQAQVLKGGRA